MSSVTNKVISKRERTVLSELCQQRLFVYLNIPFSERLESIFRVTRLLHLLTLADTQREYLRAKTDRWLLRPEKSKAIEYDESLPFFTCRLRFRDENLQAAKT